VRPKVDQRTGLLSLPHLGNFRRTHAHQQSYIHTYCTCISDHFPDPSSRAYEKRQKVYPYLKKGRVQWRPDD